MKTRDGFKLRTLGSDYILTPEGDEVLNFNKMISFNNTAAFLWKKIVGIEFTVQQLANLLIEEYGISEELAARDAKKIVEDWKECGVIE